MFRLILLVLLSLFSLLTDRMLGLFGFPTELQLQTSHPSNFREVRKNIEFTHEFQTNSQGLRYKEIPLRKPPGTFRIFVVGDSMTEGTGVQSNETFSAILEDAFSNAQRSINFINAGLAGTAPFEYGRVFFAVGPKYQPDGLLIAIHAGDVSGTSTESKLADLYDLYEKPPQRSAMRNLLHHLWPRGYTLLYQIKASYDEARRTKTNDLVGTVSSEARRRGISQQQIDEWKARLPEDLLLAANEGKLNGSILSYGLLNPAYLTDALDINTPNAEAKWNSMAAILTETVTKARSHGLEVAVVFLPSHFQYDPSTRRNPLKDSGVHIRGSWLDTQSTVQKRLRLWSQDLGVPFLDLTPTFRTSVTEVPMLQYPIDGHWTPAGHRVAATAIEIWLRDNKVFSLPGAAIPR